MARTPRPTPRSPSRLIACLALLAPAVVVPACFTRTGDADNPTAAGRPCNTEHDCPQPKDPCQVWTCWQNTCTPVAAAQDTLLPKEDQVPGDCKVLVCDGQGKAVGIADRTDQPPEDDNLCADEVCDGAEPAYPPLEAGTSCGKAKVCNGRGKCGVCLPEARRCKGDVPEQCNEDGAWESEGPCPGGAPICSGAACIGVTQVACGDGFSCARIADGTVRCFGDTGSGRLGQQGVSRVPGLSGVRRIALGAAHTCALLASGAVQCWGENGAGQLGDGTKGSRGYTAPVPGIEKAAQIAAGNAFTCALLDGGQVACWGANDEGQLGTGATAKSPALPSTAGVQGVPLDRPTEVAGLTGAAELSLGRNHGCARLSDTGVQCWGPFGFDALGLGEKPAPPAKPVKAPPAKPVPVVKGLHDAVEIAVGNEHACARLSDGAVACWGRNYHGQLGDGTNKAQSAPVKVKGLTGAASIALGAEHSCARLTDGGVRCWGGGALGQVGDAAKADHHEPFAVPGLTGVTALSSGADHVCAMLSDGSHVCWGDNQHGELGSGAAGDAPSPIVWSRAAGK